MITTIEFLKEYNDLEPQFGRVEITFEGLCKMLDAYHARKCEEAGKGLISEEQIDNAYPLDEDYREDSPVNSAMVFSGQVARTMRSSAIKALSSLQSLLEAKTTDYEEVREKYLRFLDRNTKLEELLEAKDRDIEDLSKNYGDQLEKNIAFTLSNVDLRKELQEARAEMERYKSGLIEQIQNKIRSLPRSSTWPLITEAILEVITVTKDKTEEK